jgi:catalase
MDDVLAEQVVDAINAVSGVHPGCRAAHAKGILCSGTFVAAADARGLTRAPHMRGEPVRTTARFSNGSGDPGAPDFLRDGRGLAVKFYLPDGSRADVVALTLPAFFVRSPEDFLEFTRARAPLPDTGRPDMERLGAFLAGHPESQPVIQAALAMKPPASYAQCAYNSLHAFRWLDADGAARHVRYRFEPEAGVATVDDEEAHALGADFLQQEMQARLEREPVAFRLLVQIAGVDDPVDDPTIAWPPERETVTVGRLELTGPELERERDGDVLVFDPTRVCDGIECSSDPILLFRPRAYAVSVRRRTAGASDI